MPGGSRSGGSSGSSRGGGSFGAGRPASPGRTPPSSPGRSGSFGRSLGRPLSPGRTPPGSPGRGGRSGGPFGGNNRGRYPGSFGAGRERGLPYWNRELGYGTQRYFRPSILFPGRSWLYEGYWLGLGGYPYFTRRIRLLNPYGIYGPYLGYGPVSYMFLYLYELLAPFVAAAQIQQIYQQVQAANGNTVTIPVTPGVQLHVDNISDATTVGGGVDLELEQQLRSQQEQQVVQQHFTGSS